MEEKVKKNDKFYVTLNSIIFIQLLRIHPKVQEHCKKREIDMRNERFLISRS